MYGAVEFRKDASQFSGQRNSVGLLRSCSAPGVFLVIAGIFSVIRHHAAPAQDYPSRLIQTERYDIELSVNGDYTENHHSASVYHGWNIVEPYRSTTLGVVSTRAAGKQGQWTITSNHTNEVWELDGDTVQFSFVNPGVFFQIEVQARGLNKYMWVICKHVRREIRRLKKADREAYFHALHEVYFTSEHDGKQKYGDDFRNIRTFTKQHAWTVSLNGSCTPYHFSEAFYGAHGAMAREVEKVMQLVEPSTAMHYWDFIIDGVEYGMNWSTMSPIFRPEWFGSANPVDDEHVVTEGRWAYTQLPTLGPDFETSEHNAYGIVSMRWNNNPSRYLQRAQSICGLENQHHLPTCEVMSELVSSSFSDVVGNVAGTLHGWCHMYLGGAWDCGRVNVVKAVEEHPDWTFIYDFLGELWQFWQNSMIAGVVTCPDNCTSQTSFHDCRCTSSEYDIQNLTYLEAEEILTRAKFWDLLSFDLIEDDFPPTDDDANRLDDNNRRRILRKDNSSKIQATIWAAELVASVGQLGPFATPYSSTNDPLFWPLHTFLVKVVDTARINPLLQPMNYSWSTQYTEPWFYQDHCPTHRSFKPPFDRTMGLELWKPGMRMNERYTNAELVEALNPRNVELPYVYDHWVSGVCDMNAGALPTLD